MMIERLPSETFHRQQAEALASPATAPTTSRRAFIRNTALVGGGTAAALLLSACTGDGESAETASEPSEPINFPAAEVPVGGGVVLTKHEVVVTQPEAGNYLAFSAICTHKGCVLTSVEERGAYCGCHSSYFDITTGMPVAGPAQAPLPSIPVTVSADTLIIG
ncbi:QcrA and Rieske domain-containing protein [Gulosibacter chungangensis]|uniref:Cytochrome bc1 complex Rieske iron-sulfur subunit n=1 Tax=Gulosibacter chungangensis TaxID=979746 RepID=A0A7J5BCU3_9MICO|nr:Rieske (2Fe-2S) protein [Gulosibacter chungangensis]KAB1643429.1 Rieske (2Fe-2S) protein [Gulosibacter chungangensis]